MKAYVLDTHALLWYLARPRSLGRAAARVLVSVDRGRSRAWIPAIVAVELALLHERGRSRIGPVELEATLDRNGEIRMLPLDLAQASEFVGLRGLHDPFDRMIVAAARVAGCPLVSADEEIARSGLVQVVWE